MAETENTNTDLMKKYDQGVGVPLGMPVKQCASVRQ